MAMKAILFFRKEKSGVSIEQSSMTQSQASLVMMSKETRKKDLA